MVRSIGFDPKVRGEWFQITADYFPAWQVGVTPAQAVDESPNLPFKLLRYSPDVQAKKGHILFVPHIINRPYILDLYNDVSVVNAFRKRGFMVYLIDWGYPETKHSAISFSDYVTYVNHVMGSKLEGNASLLGYCTGGIIALLYASLYADKVETLILLATPVNFSFNDPRMVVGRAFDARTAVSPGTNIPGEILNLAGLELLSLYAPGFLLNDEFRNEFVSYEFWRDFWRRTRWVLDAPSIPWAVYTELRDKLYIDNSLYRGLFQINDRVANIREIDCPLMNIMSRYDHLVPLESAQALKVLHSGGQYQEIVFPSSHVGLSVSQKAHIELWPRVVTWLEENRSKEVRD